MDLQILSALRAAGMTFTPEAWIFQDLGNPSIGLELVFVKAIYSTTNTMTGEQKTFFISFRFPLKKFEHKFEGNRLSISVTSLTKLLQCCVGTQRVTLSEFRAPKCAATGMWPWQAQDLAQLARAAQFRSVHVCRADEACMQFIYR